MKKIARFVVQKYQKQILKQWYLHYYWHTPRVARGVKNRKDQTEDPYGEFKHQNCIKFEIPSENILAES